MTSGVSPSSSANYETIGFVLTGGADAVLTGPSSFWYEVIRIRISNGTAGGSGTALIKWHDASASVDYVLNDALAIAPGFPGEEECSPLHLEVGDSIKITSTTSFHATITYDKGSNAPAKAQGSARANAPAMNFGRG